MNCSKTEPSTISYYTDSVVAIGLYSGVFEGLKHDFPYPIGVNYFQEARPLLAIVHNNTEHIIEAHVVKWMLINSDSSIKTANLHVKSEPHFNEGVLSGARTLRGHAQTRLGIS